MKKIILLLVLGISALIVGVGAAYFKNYYSLTDEERRLAAWLKTLPEDSRPVADDKVSKYIRNLNIKAGDTVRSPLLVTGEAKTGIGGGINLVDGNNKYLVGSSIFTANDRANVINPNRANQEDESFSEFSVVLYWDENQPIESEGKVTIYGSNLGRPSFNIVRIPVNIGKAEGVPMAKFSEVVTLGLADQVIFPDGLKLAVTEFSSNSRLRATLVAEGGKIDQRIDASTGIVGDPLKLHLIDKPPIIDDKGSFYAGWVTKILPNGSVEIYKKYGEDVPRYTIELVSINGSEVSFSVKP